MSQDTLTVRAAGFDLGFKQVTLSQIGATAMRLCCQWVISLGLKGCLFLTVASMTFSELLHKRDLSVFTPGQNCPAFTNVSEYCTLDSFIH